jgi:HSP20 family protein
LSTYSTFVDYHNLWRATPWVSFQNIKYINFNETIKKGDTMAKDLFDEIRRMREEMDRLFSDFYDRFYSGERLLPIPGEKMPALRPAVADVQETDEHVIVTIELPGMKKEDITLHITEKMLEVKAETKEEEKKEEEGYKSYRSRYSGFYRRIPLPAGIDADKTKATYKNGVLEVKMPKMEKKKGKEISIE